MGQIQSFPLSFPIGFGEDLENPWLVMGTVLCDGSPLEGVTVTASDNGSVSTSTGADGKYLLDIQSITYDGGVVTVELFKSQWYTTYSEDITVNISDFGVIVDATLSRTGGLGTPWLVMGTVTYDGSPLQGATITATDSSSVVTTSGADGKYVLDIQDITYDGNTVSITITKSGWYSTYSDTITVDVSDFGAIVNATLSSTRPKFDWDLVIYYDSRAGNDYIDCKCSRWSQENKSIVVETWLTKDQLNTLETYTVPGAVEELYHILGNTPLYYDSTFEGQNTLRILPAPSSAILTNSTLKSMRSEKTIYVKNLTTRPIEADKGWIETKIEGFISGTSI